MTQADASKSMQPITHSDGPALTQVGRQVHSSLARAIQPFHTGFDGDVLFTASTDALSAPELNPAHLGVLASELAWDAVLRAVNVEP